ncbi:hypothetical protein B7990_14060 [Fibrobacter sp. UWB4]|nr:hypothetical protein B7990_14060 [Fibrobacter sp. UWB4]
MLPFSLEHASITSANAPKAIQSLLFISRLLIHNEYTLKFITNQHATIRKFKLFINLHIQVYV